mmetsp:Transcript_11741/g.36685  ORF Transcript_11741/g.36685 Transcript_11741/m.36685 type:complete len:264 (+) Transcript_11741:466-1257(+)
MRNASQPACTCEGSSVGSTAGALTGRPSVNSASTSWILGRSRADAARPSRSATMRCMSLLRGFTASASRSHRAAPRSSPLRKWQMPSPERQPKWRGLSSKTRKQSSIDSSKRSARKNAVARLFQASANAGANSTASVNAWVALSSSPAPMNCRPRRMIVSTNSSPEQSHAAHRAASAISATSSSSLSCKSRCSPSSASSVLTGGVASTCKHRTAWRRSSMGLALSRLPATAIRTRSSARLSRAVTGLSTSALRTAVRKRAASS